MNERTTHIYQKQRFNIQQTHLWLIICQLAESALALMENRQLLLARKHYLLAFWTTLKKL
jgi:hypothetical protein